MELAWWSSRIPAQPGESLDMFAFLAWCILLILCWPLALIALLIYPLVWLILLPFRIVGITIHAVFGLLGALITLPARVLRGPRRTSGRR
jgi:hypothetical protein